MYKPTPDGYCGDEDNGQTSAWYVFSALGFYPVCPATDEYVLGAPLFKKATLTFENGKTLTIDAPKNSDENVYVNALQLNGTNYGKNWLSHKVLHEGGNLNFDMAANPNYDRGATLSAAPYSMTNDLKVGVNSTKSKKKK